LAPLASYISLARCGSEQAVRQWASCAAVGKLWVSRQAWPGFRIRPLQVAHRTRILADHFQQNFFVQKYGVYTTS
jgi:hypothetical protein